MKLEPGTTYPNFRTYLIRVHPEARPYALTGRVEVLSQGKHWDFSSGYDLLTAIARDIGYEVIIQTKAPKPTRSASPVSPNPTALPLPVGDLPALELP